MTHRVTLVVVVVVVAVMVVVSLSLSSDHTHTPVCHLLYHYFYHPSFLSLSLQANTT